MDKETLERFLQPFTDEIKVIAVMPDGSYRSFKEIKYTTITGEGFVLLQLASADE